MRRIGLGTIVGLTILVAGAVFAGSPDSNQPQNQSAHESSETNQPTLQFSLETSYKVLDHAIDTWHDAVLKDDRKKMLYRSDEINDIIIEDIQSNRLQVKMLVRQMELVHREEAATGRNRMEKQPENKELKEFKQYLPVLTAMICSKEELFRAISGTETFSNKYRLLGDYKSLMRQELKMPKLNLVEIPVPAPEQAAKDK